jgi:hypothetical protein
MKTQKTDKLGRPLWTVILKNGKRLAASGTKEEVRAAFNDGACEDDRFAGSDARVSQIRAKWA